MTIRSQSLLSCLAKASIIKAGFLDPPGQIHAGRIHNPEKDVRGPHNRHGDHNGGFEKVELKLPHRLRGFKLGRPWQNLVEAIVSKSAPNPNWLEGREENCTVPDIPEYGSRARA